MRNLMRDFVAKEITGVQIDWKGEKLWVCVDGQCVLRIKTPKIELTDDRKRRNEILKSEEIDKIK